MSLSDQLHAELFDVSIVKRARTVLMTVGILAFGFMLGVHYMTIIARETVNTLAYVNQGATIQPQYNGAMLFGMAVAVVTLSVAVLLEFRTRE